MNDRHGPHGIDVDDIPELIKQGEAIGRKVPELRDAFHAPVSDAGRCRALADELDDMMGNPARNELLTLKDKVRDWVKAFSDAGADLHEYEVDKDKFFDATREIAREMDAISQASRQEEDE